MKTLLNVALINFDGTPIKTGEEDALILGTVVKLLEVVKAQGVSSFDLFELGLKLNKSKDCPQAELEDSEFKNLKKCMIECENRDDLRINKFLIGQIMKSIAQAEKE